MIAAVILSLVLGLSAAHLERERDIDACIVESLELYLDLCAERSTGYESMSGIEASYDGAACQTDVVRYCLAPGIRADEN